MRQALSLRIAFMSQLHPNSARAAASRIPHELLQAGARALDCSLLERVEFGAHGMSHLAREDSSGRLVVLKYLEDSAVPWIEQRAGLLVHGDPRSLPPLLSYGKEPFAHAIFSYQVGVSLEVVASSFAGLRARSALHVALEVCAVLAGLATSGQGHGSLCARNVQIAADGKLRLLDWGLPGAPPAYYAPELELPNELSGCSAGSVGMAAEIYSLGVLIYRLLLGFEPGRPRTVEETYQALGKLVEAQHDASLVRILELCLAFDPVARYASHAELILDLGRALYGELNEAPDGLCDASGTPDSRKVAAEIQAGLDWLNEDDDGGFPKQSKAPMQQGKSDHAEKLAVHAKRVASVSSEATSAALDEMRNELMHSFRKSKGQNKKAAQ